MQAELPNRGKNFCILLGTLLLALVASVQAVHAACDFEQPPQNAPAAHDMVLHHGSLPCMLCVRAHFGAQTTAKASVAPAPLRAPTYVSCRERAAAYLTAFSLFIRPPPAL